MKILIRNLPRTLSETGLKELLEEYAEVQSCTLVLDKKSGVSKGFAFVYKNLMAKLLTATKLELKKQSQ